MSLDDGDKTPSHSLFSFSPRGPFSIFALLYYLAIVISKMARLDSNSNMNKMALATTGFFFCQEKKNLRRKWMSDNVLVDIINESVNLADINKVTTAELNRAVTTYYKHKCDILVLHVANAHCAYKTSNQCRIDGKRKRTNCYYFTNAVDELPSMPNGSSIIYDKKKLVSLQVVTRQTIKNTPNITISPLKRRRISERTKDETVSVEIKIEEKDKKNAPNINKAQEIISETFWDSPEAKCWFGCGEMFEIVENTMEKRIKQCKQAYTTSNGWRSIVEDNDQNNMCTENDIFNIRQKAKYVSIALKIALDEMPSITWSECCDRAVSVVQEFSSKMGDSIDSTGLKNGVTIQRWFRIFRSNSETFPNSHYVRRGKVLLPQLLDNYPVFTRNLVKEMDDNLAHLSGEFVLNYVMDTGIPIILEERRKELGRILGSTFTIINLLNENGLTKLSLSTIYRWIDALGYKYNERKKCYYVDNHESIDNVQYRNSFLKRYFSYELRAHRWIQISLEESKKMEEKCEISIGCGYKYIIKNKDKDDITMVEYHVDDSILFQDKLSNTKFGGNLSVRKPSNIKPLLMFGQDECIFKQYTFTKKAWMNSEGAMPLIPKDEGAGVMISAFASREFGYGSGMTEKELQKVNEYRSNKAYSDKIAATNRAGNANKKATNL